MRIKPPSFAEEKKLWRQGIAHVAGTDEAGRGPWAGPVVAAAVVFPLDMDPAKLEGLLDSKVLSEKKREQWYKIISQTAQSYGIVSTPSQEIDRIGIVPAVKKAMLSAVDQLESGCEYLLTDAVGFELADLKLVSEKQEKLKGIPSHHQKFIKGEQVSFSIAAASILAKVTRDRILRKLDVAYPHYGFARHKGYGTKAHWQALLRYGPCPQHRKSYKPIAKLLDVGL